MIWQMIWHKPADHPVPKDRSIIVIFWSNSKRDFRQVVTKWDDLHQRWTVSKNIQGDILSWIDENRILAWRELSVLPEWLNKKGGINNEGHID